MFLSKLFDKFMPTVELDSKNLMSIRFLIFSSLIFFMDGIYGFTKWYLAGYGEFSSWALVLVIGMPAILMAVKYSLLSTEILSNISVFLITIYSVSLIYTKFLKWDHSHFKF